MMNEDIINLWLGTDKISKRLVDGKNVFIVDRPGGEKLMLKIISKIVVNDEREIIKLGLECPYLVRILKLKTVGKDSLGVLMEFCDGGMTLSDRIENGPLFDEMEIYRFLFEGAHSLYSLHKAGFIHGGINPTDFHSVKTGGFKLGDYEGSHVFDSQLKASSSKSQLYCSPELLKEKKQHTNKVDIYSFGVTLLHLITGQYPFNTTNPLEADGKPIDYVLNHPNPCIKMALRMIAVDPAMRPTAEEILSGVPPSGAFFRVVFCDLSQMKARHVAETAVQKKSQSLLTHALSKRGSICVQPTRSLVSPSSSLSAASAAIATTVFSTFTKKLNSLFTPSSSSSFSSSSSSSTSSSSIVDDTVELVMQKQGQLAPSGFIHLPTSPGTEAMDALNKRLKDAPLPLPIYMFPIPKVLITLAVRTLQYVGVYYEGIFRKSIDMQVLESLMTAANTGHANTITVEDPNAYAVVLKTWLRRLSEPLIPTAKHALAVDFIRDMDNEDKEQRYSAYDTFTYYNLNNGTDISGITSFVNTNLSLANALSLKYLIRFLRIFTINPYVKTNFMTLDNIALVMAANILRTKANNSFEGLSNLRYEIQFTTCLLRELCLTVDEESLFECLDSSVRKELAVPEDGCCAVLNYYTWKEREEREEKEEKE